jgi:hypothetical protein
MVLGPRAALCDQRTRGGRTVPDVVAPRARNVAIDLLTYRHPFTLPVQEASLDDAFLAGIGNAQFTNRARTNAGTVDRWGFDHSSRHWIRPWR